MFLQSAPILYTGLQQITDRGTAQILEESEDGIFLKDKISNAFMLAADCSKTAIEWLKKYEHLNYRLLSVFDLEVAFFCQQRYHLPEILECFQAVYLSEAYPSVPGNLQIEPASNADLEFITAHYGKLASQELEEIIHRQELFLGSHAGEPIGFVGKHLEGSMGILEVLPQHRRKGYGTELENFMISHMLKEKMIPFCQVETWNEKSLNLQRNLGLTISDEKVYWIFS